MSATKLRGVIFYSVIIISSIILSGCHNNNDNSQRIEEQKAATKNRELLNSLNGEFIELLAKSCVVELENVDGQSLIFRIKNNTRYGLRYIDFDEQFLNDFGDYIGFKQLTYEALDKTEVIKSGRSASIKFSMLSFNRAIFEHRKTLKGNATIKMIKLDERSYYEQPLFCDNNSIQYCINKRRDEIGKLKASLLFP